MNIRFYGADVKSRRIIAYGDTHVKSKKFKIEFDGNHYISFIKTCGKYEEFARSQSLGDAKDACTLKLT
jgi:hypothetical protein